MSWRASSYVKCLGRNHLTAMEKMVMFVLADCYNDDQAEAWPSLPALAYYSLCSERTVMRAVASLERKGLLLVARSNPPLRAGAKQQGGGGRGNSNRYRFPKLEKGDIPPPFKPPKAAQQRNDKGDRLTPFLPLGVPLKGDSERRKKVTNTGLKGDTQVSPELGTVSEPPAEVLLVGRSVDEKSARTGKAGPQDPLVEISVEEIAAVTASLAEAITRAVHERSCPGSSFVTRTPADAALLLRKCREASGNRWSAQNTAWLCSYLSSTHCPRQVTNPVGWLITQIPQNFLPKNHTARKLLDSDRPR